VTCQTCADKGMIRLNWADADEDYAICVCSSGHALRRTQNNGRTVPALWEVWAAREQVSPSRIWLIEDVLTEDELRERGLSLPQTSSRSREAALLAAGKGKSR
jgi:hypothetical protein